MVYINFSLKITRRRVNRVQLVAKQIYVKVSGKQYVQK